MNQLKLERVVLILALGLLSSTPARSQTAPHDPKNYVLRDAGELAGSLGQLGGDGKAVYDHETGQLVGVVATKGGEFVAYSVDSARAVADGIGGFFGAVGDFLGGVGRAIDQHNPFIRRVGQDFADIAGAIAALDRDVHRAQRSVTGNGIKLVGEGLAAVGELIADNPKGPIRQEGCDGPIAMDGQSLWCQDADTINGFLGTWGKDAAERWAWEHSKDLAEGSGWRTVAYGWD